MILDLLKTDYGDFLAFGDESLADCLRQGDYWDQHLIPIFDKYINKESTVIEVGSNLGFHTVDLAKRSSQVYAFEPQQYVFWQLCANLLLNKCFNVKTYNNVVSNQLSRFHIPKEFPCKDSMKFTASLAMVPDSNGELSVTLDSLIKEKIDFIKVDAQGADLAVLQGANLIISEYKPIICFEYEKYLALELYKHTLQDYENFFIENNYDLIDLGTTADFLAIPNI